MFDSGIPREEIFVTTKLFNNDHGYDKAIAAANLSLQKLGLEYIGRITENVKVKSLCPHTLTEFFVYVR